MKSSEHYRRVMDVFDEVCDLPAAQRDGRLAQLCGNDDGLRHEVESLLKADSAKHLLVEAAEDGRSLEMLADGFDAVSDGPSNRPDEIGGYAIVREIGRGGMGVIYEAEQESPKRKVALKVLRPGRIDRELLKRFQHEAHVLGQLQHAGIAQIFEAGLANTPMGRQPFFVMELVDGEPLDQFAATNELNTRQRLELSARVCEAVQHAHQKGIIHRDLKPSNVLVAAPRDDTATHTRRTSTTQTSFTDAIGQPKILDFGIARVTDADMQTVTMQTEIGQLVGTLAYMSPEQVEGNSHDLDTRCDVYALGVMLYELLAGRRPHDLSGLPVTEAARRIREQDPPRLGAIEKRLRGDVETIVAKSLEKDRDRRYGSAAELAADIRRYLGDQPIDARPPSRIYQLGKFTKRNKGLVAGIAAAILALSVGLILTTRSAKRANDASARAKIESDRALEESARAKAALADVELISDFQGAMINSINMREMGEQILTEISSQLGDDEADSKLKTSLQMINAATLARAVIDDSVLSRASMAATERFGERPKLEADIHESLGITYFALAMYEQSLKETRAALAIRREHLGGDHLDTIRLIGNVAHTLTNSRRSAEAEPYAEEALARLRAILPEDDKLVLEAQFRLASSKRGSGKIAESLEISENLVEVADRALDSDDTRIHLYRQQLANVYSITGRHEDALPIREALLVSFWETRGENDALTLGAWSQVAQTLKSLGRLEEAEAALVEVVDRAERTLGELDPRTLLVLGKLAGMRIERGRTAEARRLLVTLLDRQQQVFPPDHPAIQKTTKLIERLDNSNG